MAQHKWHKEIKAWADGAEIERRRYGDKEWENCENPNWLNPYSHEFRIKQQPKEPQYLYVYFTGLEEVSLSTLDNLNQYELLGKIKLEVDDAD
jgi:hypothetical protein